jgi:transcriptional regulator CtsR
MNTRNNIIDQIIEQLGSECSRDNAEQIFDSMRNRDLITWDDYNGLQIVDGVDLIAEAINAV